MFKPIDKFHLLTQKVFKNVNYQLKLNEYFMFWDCIQENSDNMIYFMTELIHIIRDLEKSKKSSKLESLDSIIATIYCLSLFKKIYGDKKRLQIISESEKEWHLYDTTKDSSLVRSPYSSEIVNGIFQYFLKTEDEKIRMENILSQIVLIPSVIKKFLNISTNNVSLCDLENNPIIINEKFLGPFYKALSTYNTQLYNYHKQIKLDSVDMITTLMNKEEFEPIETGECSFVYEYLVKFLNENIKKKNSILPEYIVTSILTSLKVIPYISVKYPKHAENSLCCLFHVLKQILIFYPLGPTPEHGEQEILSTLINLVKVYKSWPFPAGFLAQELIDLLQYEAITIGNSFRYKIREEIPALDILDYEMRKNEIFLRIAYCIYNENYYALVSGILNQNSEKFNDKTNNFIGLDSHKIRVLLIAHIFSLHYKITKELLVHLSGLNPIEVFTIYCKLLNILEKCEKVDILEITILQEKALDELSLEIFSMRTENSETSYKIQELLFQEFQSYIPIYPDVFLQSIDHRQNKINIQNNLNAKNLKESHEEDDIDDIRKEIKFDEKKIFGNFTLKLKEILDEIKQLSLPLHQESFKMVVFGEDAELHSLVQELGVLFKLNYLLFTNIDMRIYIIPLGKCTMGKFLASKDLWYNRCVYLPFNQDLLLPKLDVQTEPIVNKPNTQSNIVPESLHLNFERNIFPFFVKEKLLQTYLREANRSFHIKVYEILCFKVKNEGIRKINFLYVPDKTKGLQKAPTNKTEISKPSKFQQLVVDDKPEPNETFFFSMYMEIGQTVEIQKLKNNLKINEENINELKQKGVLKFKNLDLEINANYIDFNGIIQANETWKGVVENIKINNVYKDGFEGNAPMPNSDFVEMTIIDYENSKQRDHSAKNYQNILGKYGREKLQNAFFALNMSFSMYSAVISETSGKEFDILVDGKVYGGFQQIIIQPLISQEKKDFKFTVPIMTFLPISL